MNYNAISAGTAIPDEINVFIEIPARANPVKYEIDKDSGALFVDRFLGTSMVYPCNYGFVPKTLADDGDPVDVLVVTPMPLIGGVVIPARPIGMLEMTDEKGEDAKILAVPVDSVSKAYKKVHQPDDLPQSLLSMISHFFEHYKDLEPNKWVKIVGWAGIEKARTEILNSYERYRAQST